jgi:hypothetical protein
MIKGKESQACSFTQFPPFSRRLSLCKFGCGFNAPEPGPRRDDLSLTAVVAEQGTVSFWWIL